jgi:hypothetical protein
MRKLKVRTRSVSFEFQFIQVDHLPSARYLLVRYGSWPPITREEWFCSKAQMPTGILEGVSRNAWPG